MEDALLLLSPRVGERGDSVNLAQRFNWLNLSIYVYVG